MRLAVCVAIVFQICLSAVAAPVERRVKLWVRQLDDERFELREQATAGLFKAGPLAVPAVVKAMENQRPETRSRANLIIAQWIKVGNLKTIDALDKTLRSGKSLDPAVLLQVQDLIQKVNLLWLERVGAKLEEDAGFEWEESGVELQGVAARRQVRYVSLVGTNITDAGLVHLRGFRSLETLHLSDTNISDVGLRHLSALKSLTHLYVDGTNITDAGLLHLMKHASLMHLNLAKTQVTDAGLARLKRLRLLKVLNVSSTRITDEGFVELQGFDSLEMLHFQDTNITSAGLDPLKRALPKLVTMPMFLGLDRADLGSNSKRFK